MYYEDMLQESDEMCMAICTKYSQDLTTSVTYKIFNLIYIVLLAL